MTEQREGGGLKVRIDRGDIYDRYFGVISCGLSIWWGNVVDSMPLGRHLRVNDRVDGDDEA